MLTQVTLIMTKINIATFVFLRTLDNFCKEKKVKFTHEGHKTASIIQDSVTC